MSENSSDSDSSCGWTIIGHEGSDTETVTPNNGTEGCVLSPELLSPGQEELQMLPALQGESIQDGTTLTEETMDLAFQTEEEKSCEDNVCFGAASDDSDIVTLEPPKLEEAGSQESVTAEEAHILEDLSMGSSSSSRYSFCQPEAVFPSQHICDGSSSDEASDQRSFGLRRRRALFRRKVEVWVKEWEHRDTGPLAEPPKRQCGRVCKCLVLALVVAVSLGLGHFYGIVQSQRWQQSVQKTPEDGANDMMGYLPQHAQRPDPPLDAKLSKDILRRCRLLTTAEKMSLETQKKRLATQNHHLRVSLEKGESAMGLLQEEAEKLREQIRILEEKGLNADLILENQKLRQHLEDAKQKTHKFLNQRELLLAEAQTLRSELEREQKVAASLREEILQHQPGRWQAKPGSYQEEEMAGLRERVSELEQKLSLEQQRSDLWERLYVEAKDQNGKPDAGRQKGSRGHHRVKSKSKETFLGTVKETFDAMKNSTKEFVRHHKEKIKQAKEAVKENLKKFSESVKSTFRHFKDTTKTIFDKKGNKRFGATKETVTEKKTPVFSDYSHPQPKAPSPSQKPRSPTQRDRKREQPTPRPGPKGTTCIYRDGGAYGRRGCESSREAAESTQEEPFSPCSTVVNPVLVGEFRQIIRRYLLKELHAFHHWEELNEFINQFIVNGLFTNSQQIFADFINDVKDYLKSIKEYQVDHGVFEKLDGYICRYLAGSLPTPHRPSRPDKKQRMVNIENSRHGKRAEAPSAAAL